MPLLEVSGLTKHFPVRRGALGLSTGLVRAVDSVSFRLDVGATLGLVGESGCGKTTTSRLILGLERPTAGDIRFAGEDVLALDAPRAGAATAAPSRRCSRIPTPRSTPACASDPSSPSHW